MTANFFSDASDICTTKAYWLNSFSRLFPAHEVLDAVRSSNVFFLSSVNAVVLCGEKQGESWETQWGETEPSLSPLSRVNI